MQPGPLTPATAASSAAATACDAPSIWSGATAGYRTAVALAFTMFLAPAVGLSSEMMFQETLKSAVVAFGVLLAAFLFFREKRTVLHWHALLWLPLLLLGYAAGSMAWSHTYLAAGEAVRWFILGLLLWLGLNTLSRENLSVLAWGVHWGAVTASLWLVLQFWFDFSYFPQGRAPASTFGNRNFFAEFAVVTIPFSAWLLANARSRAWISLLAATSGLVVVAIMMTGTRGAMVAMWLLALLLLPLIAWRYRRQLAFAQWDASRAALAMGVLLATVVGLGLIKTGNPEVLEEAAQRGSTALERAFKRTGSISTEDVSFGTRLVMWKATGRMIADRPLSGVGAGAWEAGIPLYQAEGSQVETDFYVHNEFLQTIAEYGLAGWLFLLALLAYLLRSAWRTLTDDSPAAQDEGPWRSVALASLLALLIVSNIGFAWHMASTAAMLALGLAVLAASDARLGYTGWGFANGIRWTPAYSRAGAVLSAAGIGLAAFVSWQAYEGSSNIFRAAQLAKTITASGDAANPRWDESKRQVLALIKAGTDVNRHNRQVTAMVGDELARWGDWKNATWVWETVASSRPHVVVILTNIARGYLRTGQPDKAAQYLERARKVQPRANVVRALEVMVLSGTGQEQKALALARDAMDKNIVDYDLLTTALALAVRAGDQQTAVRAVVMRLQAWPNEDPGGAFMQLGTMYDTAKDRSKALEYFRRALEVTPMQQRQALRDRIPASYGPDLGYGTPPPAVAPMKSSGK